MRLAPGSAPARRTWATAALVAAIACAAGACARAEAPPPPPAPAPVWGPFTHLPIDTPVVVTATFGEYRSGHFHGGLDFSTQQQVGRVVYAPLAGWVRRVRASGAGYGRALYFQADDGRLFVFGHLDAYAEPVRSVVAERQDSTGRYDQDLTFDPDRFRYAAGDTLAWTGESGAGPPHLHMEVRNGDMAMHPLAVGLTVADTLPPRLVRLTLAPLDDTSFVASPATGSVALAGAATDTARLVARGRFRAVVEAYDPRVDGAGKLAPFEVRVAERDGGRDAAFVACRFDSASWAGDMAQVEFVYDRGRATRSGGPAVSLWAPAGFRPRVFHTSEPIEREAGTIVVGAETGPRAWVVTAADRAGNRMTRVVSIAPDSGARPAPATRAAGAGGAGPENLAAVAVTRAAATLAFENGARIELPDSALFAPESLRVQVLPVPATGARWQPIGTAVRVAPALAPLRSPVTVRLPLPRGVDPARVGVCRRDGADWSWLGAHVDTVARTAVSDSRRLGTFALLRDVGLPRLGRVRARHVAPPGLPYSRWAIELRATDAESGLSSRDTYFTVNGRRVPTELDGDAGVMRWRPASRPTGTLRVEAVATDDAGNVSRATGTLVVR